MINILIIDDDAIFLSYLGSIFNEHNYKVKLTCKISDALVELSNEDSQILITDMYMPNKEDGLNFIENVSKNYPQIIIIVVSGQSEINFVIKVLSEKKVYDYILKPFKTEILKLSVEKAIEIYNLRKKKEEFIKQEETVFKDIIRSEEHTSELQSQR